MVPKMGPRGAKWTKNGAKGSKNSKQIAQDGTRWPKTAPKSRPRGPTRAIPYSRGSKMEAKIDQNRWKNWFKNRSFFWSLFVSIFLRFSIEKWSKNGRKIDQKMMKKTSRRKMLKKWKTYKNLKFFNVFWGSAGTKFAKKRSKNLWKMGLKSKSILEVIFEGFGVDFGRHFRPKNRSKNEKKLIKNKSDFKIHVPGRISASDAIRRE